MNRLCINISSLQIKMDQTLTKEGKDTKMFPDLNASDFKVTCHALSNDFLIYGSDVSYLYKCMEF